MAVPTDPFPNFVNGVDVADGDKVDARFKALYDTLNPAQVGIRDDNVHGSAAINASKLADGTLTAAKLASALADILGLTVGAATRRGASDSAGEVSTVSTSFVTLAGDSQVSVTQPSPGLTFLWASADIKVTAGPTDEARLGFQIDGTTNVELTGTNQSAYGSAPRVSVPGGFAALAPLGGPVVFDIPGAHGYRLVYRTDVGTGFFKNRKLRVWTAGY